MHPLALLTAAAGLIAPGSALVARDGSGIPPPEVRAQWPQFNESIWEKYHCFTFDKLLEIVPPCSDYCETYAIGELTPGGFARDGCHQDDFPCHCQQGNKISELIEPCIFPWLNATAECTRAQLAPIQAFVTESCTFYNATQYADYRGCPAKVNKAIKADIAAGTAPKPTVSNQAFVGGCKAGYGSGGDSGKGSW